MREGRFIARNKDRWAKYQEEEEHPDQLAENFINIIDDLSFSKTYYPKSNTTHYLNGIAAKIFTGIYQNRPNKNGVLYKFLFHEAPFIFYKYRKYYLFTAIVFLIFVALGVVSTIIDPEFPKQILGDYYVEMTIENIENGDPFNVYKDDDPLFMFIRIAFNNVVVMAKTFIYGIGFGIFTLYSLFVNGIMLGCFHALFFQYNLGWDSILVVWIHGAIEINAIVISGVAGLIIGFSFLFPGTYTRWESLVRSSKDAAKLIITLIPLIIIAAMLESWVTRHTEMKTWMSVGIISSSLIIFFGYYIFLPWYRFRNNKELEKLYEEELI